MAQVQLTIHNVFLADILLRKFAELDQLISGGLAGVFHYSGSVNSYDDLPEEGMKIDRMLYEKFEDKVRKDPNVQEIIKNLDIDAMEWYLKDKVFDKPTEFFNIPKFLLRKYKKLIKKKFKNKLKRNNIVLTEFDITNDQSDILQLTNNLESILNNRNIVKNNQKLLDLIFIRNRSYFKSDPVAFDEFVNIFNDLLNWLNIEIVTEKNNLYNLNKYINKLRNDYLDIEDQEFMTKTKEIISFYQSIDKKEIINIISDYNF